MTPEHRIVVSAENNPYIAWQTKLFHFSCLSRLQQAPLIIVHELGLRELHPDFEEIARAGGCVRRAPSYRLTGKGYQYPPKNSAGTLLHAAELCSSQEEFIVLCDPDMIFVRRPEFPRALSGDYYSYINYEHDFVEKAIDAIGISSSALDLQKEELRCGVPHVIPLTQARQFAEMWLQAIDLFPPHNWENSMYAFGLVAVKLGLRVGLTRLMESNYWPNIPPTATMIHYCYGDETWSKRHYFTEEQAPSVWEAQVEAPRETILGEILSQIQEARNFYNRI